VDPVTLEVTIDRPREVVFDYLADVANHPEFTDHYLKDWRLTRVRSSGTGAGARYRVAKRGNRFGWADMNLVELQRPWRIVAVGRGGKYNRIKTFQSWELEPASGGGTRVEWTYETEPALPTDRLLESFGRYRHWSRRRGRRALKRLQSILEEDRGRGARATVGGL
jgi:uncharacterized protein YndB with AHSA1/START domain